MPSKEALEALDKFMDELVDEIFTYSQENIVKIKAVDTGEMLTHGNVNRKFLEKEIVYPAPQSLWIEYGTHPHPVSKKGREAIAAWAQRKLGIDEKEAESAAWGIANKIRAHGQAPRPFLRPAIDQALVRRGVL
jgi:hypothetical protein